MGIYGASKKTNVCPDPVWKPVTVVWWRTNGVNTNGAAAAVMIVDRLRGHGYPLALLGGSYFIGAGRCGWKPSSSSSFSIRAFRAYPPISSRHGCVCVHMCVYVYVYVYVCVDVNMYNMYMDMYMYSVSSCLSIKHSLCRTPWTTSDIRIFVFGYC